MSSGLGVKGTIGRCYPFYADLRKCAAKKHAESPRSMCWQENEDYFECLHGMKEKKRRAVVAEARKMKESLGDTFDLADIAKDE